jgi:hypothetical protein
VADSAETDAIIKKEPDVPAQDPIVSRSTSGILLICALLLAAVLGWSLYDEIYGQRPWRSMQQEFVRRENRLLKRLKDKGVKTEGEVKQSAEYQQLDAEAKAAREKVAPQLKQIDQRVKVIDSQLGSITDTYQNVRGDITVDNYRIETAHGKSKQDDIRRGIEKKKQQTHTIYWPADDGSGKTIEKQLNFPQMDENYTKLKAEKTELTTKRGELLKEPGELEKKRDEYLKNNVVGLTAESLANLQKRNQSFDFKMRQINVQGDTIVDRCETCHLGVREPLSIAPADMRPVVNKKYRKPDALAQAFVSHPNKELLDIHNPDRFGCSSCHGGNGRATTSIEKAHGQNKFWLHPLYDRENMQAGCQQCHSSDRVLQGASVLNLGKDLFQYRGCVGCHRYEGFDRETDSLANARQSITQLKDQIAANEREAKQSNERIGEVTEEEAQKLLARAEYLRVTNSQLAARISQLETQSKYLMYDQKKVGPNLKDVQLKLRKEWIPVWLQNPQNFRPGTKMPTFWRIDGESGKSDDAGRQAEQQRETDERKAIAAFIWQQGFQGKVPEKQTGDATHGKELFETRGCMACHSIGQPGAEVGGDFAANLTRVGEKANFDYIARWIYNPRERWAPYCPQEKRDLTREDYEKKGLPYVFDADHSKCPNDGAELQIQNMTVMPNFRLPESDARDIATYLFSLSGRTPYPDASYMDDPNLKDQGRALVKQYGCAGCHEISGFEEEQRIGKELTTEGATPIERLDFALLTHDAETGKDPHDESKNITDPQTGEAKPWYNHKGFFSNKIADPAIYDKGKEKDSKDLLRMPKPSLKDKPEWNIALTTFLLGSVGLEGANVPQSFFYTPDARRKDIQDGWWVIKKYNCMGCHNVQVGQKSVLSGLPRYQDPDWKDQLPPQLTSEGARVDPDWLLRFLSDPSLSGTQGKAEPGRSDKTVGESPGTQKNAYGTAKDQKTATQNAGSQQPSSNSSNGGEQAGGQLHPQPGADRNGVRVYLKARMPTFSFSPNELQALVRFFMAVSSQSDIYIKEKQDPLSEEEKGLARQLFTSRAAPCLKCHITGDPEHDKTATAPNFLLASERLKPAWTFRWLLDPQQISPGTPMPSGLFKKDGERWVFSGETPESFNNYHKDHADLLVRYMFQMTPDEQRRLMSTAPTATSGQSPEPREKAPPAQATNGQKVSRNLTRRSARGRVVAAHRKPFSQHARAPGLRTIAALRRAKFARE